MTIITVAVAFPLFAACSSVEQTYSEFFEEEPMPERVQVDEEELEGGSVPNLSTVPMKRPTPTPAQERERLRRSLQEDHRGSGIERQPEPESPDQSNGDEMSSGNTSYLDHKTRNSLTRRLTYSEPDFAGVQLAQVTVNEDVMTGNRPNQDGLPTEQASGLTGVIYFRHGSEALDHRDHTIISQIAQAFQLAGLNPSTIAVEARGGQ